MTNRRTLLKTIAGLSAARVAKNAPQPSVESDRAYWIRLLTKLAEPVLANLARGTLKRNMPVECADGNESDRRKYSHLEAFARLLAGIAPWLEAPSTRAMSRATEGFSATTAMAPDSGAGGTEFQCRHSGCVRGQDVGLLPADGGNSSLQGLSEGCF